MNCLYNGRSFKSGVLKLLIDRHIYPSGLDGLYFEIDVHFCWFILFKFLYFLTTECHVFSTYLWNLQPSLVLRFHQVLPVFEWFQILVAQCFEDQFETHSGAMYFHKLVLNHQNMADCIDTVELVWNRSYHHHNNTHRHFEHQRNRSLKLIFKILVSTDEKNIVRMDQK